MNGTIDNEPIDFEEARARAAEVLNPEQEQQEPVVDEAGAEEGLVEQTDPTPEPAGQSATPQYATTPEIDRLRQENQELEQRIDQMQQAMAQQSEAAQEAVTDNALSPDINFARLREQMFYGTDEESEAAFETLTERAAQEGYARAMAELKPMVDEYARSAADNEWRRAFDDFRSIPDIGEMDEAMSGELRNLSERYFSDDKLTPADKMARSYIYRLGMEAFNNRGKTPVFTRDDAVRMYDSDPELQKMIEARRYAGAKGAQMQDPPVLDSGGYANAAPTIPNSPMNMEEAGKMAKRYLERLGR